MKAKIGMSIIVIFVLLLTTSLSANANKSCKDIPMFFGNADGNILLNAYESIKKCIKIDGEVTAYVNGVGGSVSEAMMFFDLMRTSGAYKHTTFIAVGEIWSATFT